MRTVLVALALSSVLAIGGSLPAPEDGLTSAGASAVVYAACTNISNCLPLPPPSSCGQPCDDSERYQQAVAAYEAALQRMLDDPTDENLQTLVKAAEKAQKISDSIGAKAQKQGDKQAEKCQKAQDKDDAKKIAKFCPA